MTNQKTRTPYSGVTSRRSPRHILNIHSLPGMCMAVYIMVFITLKSITTVAGEGSGTSSGFFLNTRAPGIPSNITPLNSATNVAFQMLLLSSPFANEGDRHTASQWLITLSNATGTFQWDSGQNTNDLIQLTVPASLSYFASRYFWQVQHKDNHGMWSGYSAQTWFDTGLPAPPDIAASDGLYSDGISITKVCCRCLLHRVIRTVRLLAAKTIHWIRIGIQIPCATGFAVSCICMTPLQSFRKVNRGAEESA